MTTTQKSYATLKQRVLRPDNLFHVLGAHLGHSADELQAIRREVAGELHPDRNGDPQASALMATVNAAYATLTDKAARIKYLATLRTGRQTCVACGGMGFLKRQAGFKSVTRKVCGTCHGCGQSRKEK